MYKLESNLSFFRFNSNVHTGKLKITWYVIENDNFSNESGRCFSQSELNLFLNFLTQNPINFPDNKNYFSCDEEENTPFCSLMHAIASNVLNFPNNLIIRKFPQLSSQGSIYSCMDIILTDQNMNDHHTYNLVFDVIGRIEQ